MSARRWRLVDGCRCHASLGKILLKDGRRLDNPTGAQFETWVVERNSGDRFEMILDRNACTKLKWWRFHMIFFGNPRSLRSVHVQKPNFGGYCPWLCFNHPENSGVSKWSSWLFPPTRGKHGNFQKDGGAGNWPKLTSSPPKNLGMTKWCCKMKAISFGNL